MKLIQAVVERGNLDRIQEELNRVEVYRLTVSEVQTLRSASAETPGLTFEEEPGIRLEIAVNENFVKPTLDALYRALEAGEGTLYVLPLKDAIRIRTGETGPEAI